MVHDDCEQGVYVQAWVWVRTEPECPVSFTNEGIRTLARAQYHDEGTIEIDDNAAVSGACWGLVLPAGKLRTLMINIACDEGYVRWPVALCGRRVWIKED